MILSIILFLFILGILVFVHELGHFVAAKKLGVKVEEFAFGFKPKLWSIKKGETVYAINAIPIGGYCSMYGEDPTESPGKGHKDWGRSFTAKPRWARAIILVAGVFMNFVLAWIIYTIIFTTGFDPLIPGMVSGRGVKIIEPVKIASVEKKSPADLSGLKIKDQIIAVDGVRVGSPLEVVVNIVQKEGKPANLEIKRGDKTIKMDITPRKNPPEGSGPLGIGLSEAKIGAVWYKAPGVALLQVGSLTKMTVNVFGNFVKKLVVKQEVSKDVSGMVGVGYATDFVRHMGVTYVLQLMAMISISLAVMNLLPIIPLDGGHLFVIAVESVRRKKLTEGQMNWMGIFGLGFILILVVVTTLSDILRFGWVDKVVGLFK